MKDASASIYREFNKLPGKRAWGLVRTHGSMFFLEIGDPLPRRSERKVHGEWHFLVEVCHWRIERAGALLACSDDPQGSIDKTFSSTELGSVVEVKASVSAHDLQIVFSSGLRIETFGASAEAKSEWTQWLFYGPENNVWVAKASGALVQVDAYA